MQTFNAYALFLLLINAFSFVYKTLKTLTKSYCILVKLHLNVENDPTFLEKEIEIPLRLSRLKIRRT